MIKKAPAGTATQIADERQSQLKLLIARGKEQGYLTYAEVNDHLPSEIVDPEQIEDIVNMINDMGIPVYENDVQRLSKDGRPFWIAGLGDQLAYAFSWRFGTVRHVGVDDLGATLRKVTDDAPVIRSRLTAISPPPLLVTISRPWLS